MKSETEQALSTLEMLSQDLFYSCVGDEPYKPVLWETDLQGKFCLEKFLQLNDALVSFTPEEFFHEIQVVQPAKYIAQYEELFSLLEEELTHLETFSYFVPELPDGLYGAGELLHPDIDIPIILGNTSNGESLGLMLRQYDRGSNFVISDLLPPHSASPSAVSLEILAKTRQLTANLPYKSSRLQSIYGTPLWVASMTDSRNTIIERVLYDAVTLSYGDIDRFCQVGSEYEQSSIQGHRLSQFFKSGLTASRVYEVDFNFGESYCVHYCLGQVSNQDWVGLVTVSYTC